VYELQCQNTMVADLEHFMRRDVASDSNTNRKTARCRTVALSSCRLRSMPNGAMSYGVLSRCYIVALLKSKDLYIRQAAGRHRDNTQHDNAPSFELR
jgi:hypothetical protein